MKGRRIREKGKIKLSDYFKKFKEGDRIAIVKDLSARIAFPERICGKSGQIKGFRGTYCLIELKDGNKTKTFIIHPIHLRRLK